MKETLLILAPTACITEPRLSVIFTRTLRQIMRGFGAGAGEQRAAGT